MSAAGGGKEVESSCSGSIRLNIACYLARLKRADEVSRVPTAEYDRIEEIDILRGIAITAVVGIHTTWTYMIPETLRFTSGRLIAVLHLACGFGVPLFFALSAAGLTLRHTEPTTLRGYLGFLQRRLTRLLPAYVLWSTVSALLFRRHLLASPTTYVEMLLTGSADAQFYFIPLLVELYLLWPLLKPVARGCHASSKIAIATFLLSATAAFAVWRLGYYGYLPHHILLTLPLWVGYIGLGIAAAPYISALRRLATRNMPVFATGGAAAFVLWIAYRLFIGKIEPAYDPYGIFLSATIHQSSSGVYIYGVMFFAAVVSVRLARTFAGKLFVWLGEQAYGVYLAHLVVLTVALHRIVPPAGIVKDGVAVAACKALGVWFVCLFATVSAIAVAQRVTRIRPFVSNRW